MLGDVSAVRQQGRPEIRRAVPGARSATSATTKTGTPDVLDKTPDRDRRPAPTVTRPESKVPRAETLSHARRFRGDGAAADSEIPLRLHLRRRRDRRRGPRQPKGLRRIRLRAARAQRRLRPRPDHDAVRQDLRLAVRHSADGLFGAVRLSRRHRADARRGCRKRADDPLSASSLITLEDVRRENPGRLVPGLSGGRAGADRAAGRPGGGGRLRHLRGHRRRAGAAEPREQHPQRLSGADRGHAAVLPGIRSRIRTGCSAPGRAR